MNIHTSLHAEHQLDQLAGQFEHWRQTRSHSGERIPQHLWDQAAALAQVLPRSRVAQHLRLSPSDLKKHTSPQPEVALAAPRTPTSFVEVPSASTGSPAPAAIEIDLERPDGARLHLRCPESASSLATVMRAFLEGAP
jgi:hypothetical protein